MLYLEDLKPGRTMRSPVVSVDGTEMLEFAKVFDPWPIHVDEVVARSAVGGLTAPGVYVLAIKTRLMHQLPEIPAVIVSLGYDEVRFLQPLRPGDIVYGECEVVARRESNSSRDRGVVSLRQSLIRHDGTVLMSHLDTVLVRRRVTGTAPTGDR